VTVSGGSALLAFEELRPLIGEHILRVTVSLEDVEAFKAAVLALRNDNPKLEFKSWAGPNTVNRETMCAEAARDGHKDVFIGILGEAETQNGDLVVGTAEFRVRSDQEFVLTDEDLALVTADLLSTSGEKTFAVASLNSRRDVASVAYQNELAQNYPNPFNPSTTISFSLARDARAELSIYDVRGARVRTLVDARRERGIHRIQWDGRNQAGEPVASGVYFYRLKAGAFSSTKKMVLLK
jgi:hypothetical protein